MKHIIRSSSGVLLAGMIAAGCATAPPASEVAAANTAIGNAGQAIGQAAADPHVVKYAMSELERANTSLNQAKVAWNDKRDVQASTHYAYLAEQRAKTAKQLADARAAEQAVTLAAAERDQAVAAVIAQRQAQPTQVVAEQVVQQDLVGFAVGKATLPRKARQMVDNLVNTLKSNPDRVVVIDGHTDSIGSPAYNQALALQRAESVRAALIARGVETSRIIIRSHGEQAPLASNDTSAGRSENRRAQIIIADMDRRVAGSSQGAAATQSGGGKDERRQQE